MMKPAEDRPRNDATEPLNWTSKRCILAQGKVRPDIVVMAGIDLEHPTQVGLAEDDDVIEAFPADRTDPSVRLPILPG